VLLEQQQLGLVLQQQEFKLVVLEQLVLQIQVRVLELE
jgi:hypothetical protein